MPHRRHPRLTSDHVLRLQQRTAQPPTPRYNNPTMLRLTLALLAALALTACDNDDEVLSGVPLTPTPTNVGDASTIGDAITICTEIGVPGEATPSSPTPEPSCEPGDDFTSIPGIRGAITEPPPLPPNVIAVTRYLEFEIEQPGPSADVALPLTAEVPIGLTFAWYTHDSGQWRALDTTVQIHRSTISGQDAMASGEFDPIPRNLILLAEP